MMRRRLLQGFAALLLTPTLACSRTIPEQGPLQVSSEKVDVSGEYKRVNLESVERVSIEDGKFVVHGPSASVAVDLPATADPDQKNKGWALVTEGGFEGTRTLTFTHETSLDDFTITVPAADGQIQYGSLGARDGGDILLFAYGSGSKTYWGWVSIKPRAASGK